MQGLLTATIAASAAWGAASGRGTVHSLEDARRRSGRPAAREAVRVLVVAGHAITRAGLRLLVEADCGVSVVGEAPTGRDAARLLRALSPHVVLLDAGRLEPDAVASTRLLAGRVAILLLTESDPEGEVLAAVRAGATGVLAKDSYPALLASAVRTVAAGGALLPPRTTRTLITEFVNASTSGSR